MRRWVYSLAMMAIGAALCLAVQADTPYVPAVDPAQIYVPIAKKVTPSVVNIYTKRVVRERVATSPLANDPFFQQFFSNNPALSGGVREKVERSLGSGVIIRPDGLIVTSYHVIKDAEEVNVVLPDRREFEATVTRRDPQTDLAVLKIDAKTPLPALPLRDSDTLEIGEVVLAVGNPFAVGQTVTHGIISGLARATTEASDYQFFIQTDAPINPGNSGGALVDLRGNLIGINTAIYSTSGGSLGIGFAVPANIVKTVMAGSTEGGALVHPWIGAQGETVTAEAAESLGMASPRGVLIKRVTRGGPAETAGIKPGDIITGFGGNEVADERALAYRIATAPLGTSIEVKLLRQGKGAEEVAHVTLVAPPKITLDARVLKAGPLAGIQVATLTPELAAQLNMENAAGGAIVLGGKPEGMAGSALQKGDIIVKVNGKAVASAAELEKLLAASSHRWEIVFQRGGNMLTLSVNQ